MMRLLFIFLVIPFLLEAQSHVYRLDTSRQVHTPSGNMFILVDSFEQYDSRQIIEGKSDNSFVPLSTLVAQKNNNYTYWLRLQIQALAPVKNWIILVPDSDAGQVYNDILECFVTNEAHVLLSQDKAGALIPRSQKKVRRTAGFNGLSISLEPNQVYTVYVKVSNPYSGSSIYTAPVFQDPSIPVSVHPYVFMLRILNVISIMFCILSFFFYIFVKERAYLFFALYTLILSQHYLILHPDVPFIDTFIPEHPFLVAGYWNLLTSGGFILFCLFGRAFINLNKLSSKTDKWFRWYLIGWSVIVVINSIALFVTRQRIFPFYIEPILIITSIGFFIRFAFFRSILTRLFVAGAIWLILFTVLGVLRNNGVWFPLNPWPVGQVGQLLIYAAALAYKVRLNERARAEASRIRDIDEIKSRFFANISHEFRTPLTLIQGPLQQIEENANGSRDAIPVALRHIKTMRRNTDRLLELVNQLLDLSKLDSGKMKLQLVKGDLLQLLRALTASFESVAERKSINYHVHFPDDTSIKFFDKDKIEKIVSNILANAFKYTPETGTVSVTVDIENERLRIMVEDNGPGIPKKELDKIFDRFYQIEGTEDKGSGIGLALVKELVTLYRGQISVNSEPGKGSRFRITLPVGRNFFSEDEFIYGEFKPETNFTDKNIFEKEERLASKSQLGNLPLLLVVEDNADLRHYISEIVSEHYNVIEAVNGKEGLEKAIYEVPDVIISDVMMPIMDGFALTQKLKEDERTSHIPVILLTAKAGQTHKLEGLTIGADDYLVKPFDAPELMTRVQNLVNQRKLLRRKFAGEILLKPSEVAVKSTEQIFLQKILTAIEINMSEENFGVEELAKELYMSRSQLHRKLVALTGQSPSELLKNTRLLRAKELLQKKSASPSEVAFQVGFNSHAYFSKCFKEEFGISPSEVEAIEKS